MIYITIIPARGGSKRFPGKNVHPFMGKPLISHSICCSRACDEVSRTYVSTDDEQIRQISRQYGAEIIDRPVELGDDLTSSAAVMQNAIEQLIWGGGI